MASTVGESKVSERLSWLSGRSVRVRLSYAELGQVAVDEFTATYRDCLPMGRTYFFVFESDGQRRLIRTENVVEMVEQQEVA